MRILVVALALALGAASTAHAQLFSPGPLSKAHASLEGLTGCTQCHVEGGQHDNGKCLACHKEIGKRIGEGAGYHNAVRSRLCAECHREHRGEKAKIIDWQPSKEKFNHNLTGWLLLGEHKKQECKTCHETRRISDGDILKLEKKRPETMLGISTTCNNCHFDEHRGQEGKSCEKCHSPEDKFPRAPKFNHNSRAFTSYFLTGKHRGVECKGCHDPLLDNKTSRDAFPTPKDASYLQLKDVPHAQCTACHDDPHRGNFGKSCDKCHVTEGWKNIKEGAQDTGFHDKHAFKLRGEHRDVTCKACHGPFPGVPARFKGVKFKDCADCHVDAHVGQIPVEDGVVKCDKCHTVNGWLPVLFDVELHKETRFPLEGAHRAVACNLCHKSDAKVKDRFSRATVRELLSRGRKVIVSDARLVMPDVIDDPVDQKRTTETRGAADCNACHSDPHGGQFRTGVGTAPAPHVEKKTCVACHSIDTFKVVTFKHDDSRFPLTGKHKEAQCNACHDKGTRGKMDGVIQYRGIGVDCADCHADAHVGQLAKNGLTDCGACHGAEAWKPAKFDHDKQSTFALDGKHKKAKCEACHAVVEAKGEKIVRYKPLPEACVKCHDDEHKGAFDAFNPLSPKKDPRCGGCHNAEAWMPARFAHDRAGFVLTGKHAIARCASCHGSDTKRNVGATCASCHNDPHAQEFGLACQGCHTTERFEGPAFPVDAHRKTAFPLSGRHAALPCDECHIEKRDKGFTRAALDCADCHANDARGASRVTVDHSLAPFGGKSCGLCHIPATFSPAQFAQHDKCFPISRGVHAPVRCAECHKNLAGARFTNTCEGVPVKCAECHEHIAATEDARHRNVPGYEHRSEKCAGCHRP